MKFNKKIFLMLFLWIIPLKNVFASSNLYVECPSGSGVGTTVDCGLFISSDIEISAVRTKLSVSNNLEFIGFKTDSSWQGNGDNGDIALYTYPNQIGQIKLGIISIKIKDNTNNQTGTMYFNDVYFYKADFSGLSVSPLSKNIKILSNNNDLASLSLLDYNITPKFHKDIKEYKAIVDSNIIVIEGIPEDKSATISGTGRKELKYGENTFIITVTSENENKKEYKLIVTRVNNEKKENNFSNQTNQNLETNKTESNNNKKEEQEKNKDSKLKELKVTGYNIDFNKDTYSYNIDVSSNIDKLEIEALPNSDKSKITIIGNDSLSIGKNEITITVVAEDGNKSIYTIYVTKKSNICPIKSIKILNYNLDFECDKYDYELKINKEDSLNIEIIPNDKKTKVNIYDNDNLKNGDIITIKVKIDNTDYKYHIKILKNNSEELNIINNKQFIFLTIVISFILIYLIVKVIVKKRFLNKK